MAELIFDSVVISTPDGDRELSVEDFRDLSLWDRTRLVLEGSCKFFREGEPVAVDQALDALRRQSAREG